MAKKSVLILTTTLFLLAHHTPIKSAKNSLGTPPISSNLKEQDPLPTYTYQENYHVPSPLYEATQNEEFETVKILIKKHPEDINKTDLSGNAPIHVAAEEGYTAIFRELIQNGANIEIKNRFNERPIHKACLNKNLEILKLLLTHNANIHAKNFEGQTALHIASSFGFLQGMALLLAYNAPINKKNSYGQTSLHLAVEDGDSLIIRTLISDEKADLEATDNKGQTALHMATQQGDLSTIKLLVEYGADANRRDFWGFGKTAQEIALKNGDAQAAFYFEILSKLNKKIENKIPEQNRFSSAKSLVQFKKKDVYAKKPDELHDKK